MEPTQDAGREGKAEVAQVWPVLSARLNRGPAAAKHGQALRMAACAGGAAERPKASCACQQTGLCAQQPPLTSLA